MCSKPNQYGFAFLDAAYDIANEINLSKNIYLGPCDETNENPESFLLFEDCLDPQGFIIEEKLIDKINCICKDESVQSKMYTCFITEGMAGYNHIHNIIV